MKLKEILLERGIYGAFERPSIDINKIPKGLKNSNYIKDKIIKLILKSRRNTIPKSKLEKVGIDDLISHYYEVHHKLNRL